MEVEEAIYTQLSGYAGLSALVAARIYPNHRTQDAVLPSIDFRRVSTNRYPAMGADPALVKARFQIDTWGSTYDSANAVKKQVRLAMQRWKTTTGMTVADTFIIDEIDLYDDDTRQHHIATDIEVHYYE